MVMGLTLPLKLAAEKLVWGKIRDGVGGRIKVVVSGGSSLPSFLEDFFEMAGVRCAVVVVVVQVRFYILYFADLVLNRLANKHQ